MADDTLTMLADAVAAFAKPDSKRTRLVRETDAGFDPATWTAICEQGWLSALAPESQGGLGLGAGAMTTIARRLGYALYPEPFVASAMAVTALVETGAAARLPEILEGKHIAALAWQADGGALDASGTGVRATAAGERIRLAGSARFTMTAGVHEWIVAAASADGPVLLRVPADAAGLGVEREKRADSGPSARLLFSDVTVSAPSRIASGPAADTALRRAIDVGVLATAAELSGLIERMLEMTLEYLRTREQFGRKIGSFQILQHRAVDLWIQQELSLAAVAEAVAVFDDPAATARARSIAASSAKARAADAALLVGKQAIQLHGAIGMTDEYDLGLYFNRALVLSAWLGNAADHRARYATLKEAA